MAWSASTVMVPRRVVAISLTRRLPAEVRNKPLEVAIRHAVELIGGSLGQVARVSTVHGSG